MWYNEKATIELSLTSLKNFNELINERYKAGYERRERLNEFVIMGVFYLDNCGNCGKIIHSEKNRPLVQTTNEAAFYLENRSRTVSGSVVPPHDAECPCCNQGWTLKNCYDSFCQSNVKYFNLNDFIGKNILEVIKYFHSLKKIPHYMNLNQSIRNDRLIDLTLDKYNLPKNKRGWMDNIPNNYIIQAGDEGFVHTFTYLHLNCQEKYISNQWITNYKEILNNAGQENIEFEETENEYCGSRQCCGPWIKIHHRLGTITMGWRKRVIDIDWTNTGVNFLDLFPDEHVTKSQYNIHAWSSEKASEYLKKIFERLNHV